MNIINSFICQLIEYKNKIIVPKKIMWAKEMLDIKEEIQILLLRNRLSMRKIAELLREKGYSIPKASGLSYRFSQKRVLFETVQQILDYLGYELMIVKKNK